MRPWERLLRRTGEFTALFAISDAMAVAAIKALDDAGRRVPEDCSVMAIDGITMSAYTLPTPQHAHPAQQIRLPPKRCASWWTGSRAVPPAVTCRWTRFCAPGVLFVSSRNKIGFYIARCENRKKKMRRCPYEKNVHSLAGIGPVRFFAGWLRQFRRQFQRLRQRFRFQLRRGLGR